MNANFLNYGFLQEIYFLPKSNQSLTLKTWLQHNERSLPQLLTNESGIAANSNRQSENSIRAVAEWKRYSPQSRLSVKSSLNLQYTGYILENSVSGFDNQVVIDSQAKIRSLYNRADFRHQFNGFLNVLSGIEVNLHQVNSENNKASSANSGYDKKRIENSLLVEIEAKMNSQLRSVLLFRETMIDFRHQSILPLFRVNYQPGEINQLVFSGSIARNSHTPTLNDLYFIPGGNPNLRSENGIQTEIGCTKEFLVCQIHLRTGISLFHSGIKDWIVWLPTFQGYWEPMNVEKVVSKGLEANIDAEGVLGGLRYYLKYREPNQGQQFFWKTIALHS
jgi:iron complex outermembrane receptor protein